MNSLIVDCVNKLLDSSNGQAYQNRNLLNKGASLLKHKKHDSSFEEVKYFNLHQNKRSMSNRPKIREEKEEKNKNTKYYDELLNQVKSTKQ
jgi:hypothetical protein